jgi:hypothetical protein
MTNNFNRLYFGEWLDAYKGTDPLILDLQHDFKRSVRARRGNALDHKTPLSVYWDIKQWGGCSEAIDALKRAAAEYEKQPDAYENTWADLFD